MSVFCITGGSGFLGTALTHALLSHGHKVRTLSRSEHQLTRLEESVDPELRCNLSTLCGDIRDRFRLYKAFSGVEYVIHAAALKGVPRCEYDPQEAISINIDGSMMVADACNEMGVKRAVFVSTDKACSPVTLYGYTKATAERAWLAANRYSAGRKCTFTAVRYGNVFNSAGSVWQVWARSNGQIKVTDRNSTRFHITLPQALSLVLETLEGGKADEVTVPKLATYQLGLVADCWGGEQVQIGLRNGEKLHESMISRDESPCAVEREDRWILTPGQVQGKGGWEYTSGSNTWWLTRQEVEQLVREARV